LEWLEIKVKTNRESVDLISDIFYNAGITGVVVEDPEEIKRELENISEWECYEDNIFDFQYEGVVVTGYLPISESLNDKITFIKHEINKIEGHNSENKDGLGEMTTKWILEENWAENWKKFFKPNKVGRSIVIKPTWEEYIPKDDEIIIDLDPGMAFGTGDHETTSMCINLLEKYLKPGDTVFDIGCGSGILSICAGKLGAKKVIGIDLDELAVKVSKENVILNSLEDVVEIHHGDLTSTLEGKADIVVSNIIAEAIVSLSNDIHRVLKDDGLFIASGIIKDKIDLVSNAFKNNRLRIIEKIEKGEWVAVVSKPQGDRNE